MDPHDAYEQILATLHEATFDESRWSAASALIDTACGATGNSLVFGDGSLELTGVLFARFCYGGERCEEAEREYFRRYYPIDEHLPRLRRLPPGRIAHVTELFTEQERKTSVTWEAMAAHYQDSLKVRLDGVEESRIFWSLADPVDAQGWCASRTEMIARLLPHLRQFLLVRQALVEAQALGRSPGTLLDIATTAVLFLDRRARIAEANDVAAALLREGDGLYEEEKHLHARAPAEDNRLQRVIARTIPPFGVPAATASMAVTRPQGALPLVVHATPVQIPTSDVRPQRVATVVLVMDARNKTRVDSRIVQAMLGLTPAQSEVAVLLAEDRSIRQIANATGRREKTVRWHLGHVCNKLGVHRQIEVAGVIRALATMPRQRR